PRASTLRETELQSSISLNHTLSSFSFTSSFDPEFALFESTRTSAHLVFSTSNAKTPTPASLMSGPWLNSASDEWAKPTRNSCSSSRLNLSMRSRQGRSLVISNFTLLLPIELWASTIETSKPNSFANEASFPSTEYVMSSELRGEEETITSAWLPRAMQAALKSSILARTGPRMSEGRFFV